MNNHEINAKRRWSFDSVRAACIRNHLYTGGWRDAYRALGYQAGKDFDPNSRLSGGQRRKVLGVGV